MVRGSGFRPSEDYLSVQSEPWEKAHLKTQEWLGLAESKIEMQSKWFTVVQFDLNSNFKLDLNSVKRVDS